MATIDESIVIPVPPEEVFDYLEDPTHVPEHDPTILTSELDGDGPVRVGSRFKGKARVLGRTFDFVSEVTEHDRPNKMSVRSVEAKIGDFTISYTMTPEAGGTRVTYHLESAPGLGGLFGRLADSLVIKTHSRQIRANLATISEILTEHKDHGHGPNGG